MEEAVTTVTAAEDDIINVKEACCAHGMLLMFSVHYLKCYGPGMFLYFISVQATEKQEHFCLGIFFQVKVTLLSKHKTH